MSDAPQGPGWWQASDGKFYPPTDQPGPVGSTSLPIPPQPQPPSAGFWKSLYDFQFTEFVTPRLIRFFYGFLVVIWTIVAVVYLLVALASGESAAIVVGLLGVPILYVIYVVFTRISFELIAIVFRMADDLRAIRRRGAGL